MLKTSLNRMAFYADCENHSQGSLDSGFYSRVPSARATPTVPQLPHITASSAPSSPHSPFRISEQRRSSSPARDPAESDGNNSSLLCPPFLRSVNESPLLVARRERETMATTPTLSSPHQSSTSLSSTSKTISPSFSSQALLPKRRNLNRSRSAEQPRQPLLPQRRIRGTWSDTNVQNLQYSPTLLEELRLNSNFV